MKRREFITLLGGVAVVWPMIAAQAQDGGRIWRIGHVLPGTPDSFGQVAAAFEARLAELGYVVGQNMTIVTQYYVYRKSIADLANIYQLPSCSTRNRVVLCSRGCLPIDWYVGLAG